MHFLHFGRALSNLHGAARETGGTGRRESLRAKQLDFLVVPASATILKS